jgi:biopolymer transport protein ExbD
MKRKGVLHKFFAQEDVNEEMSLQITSMADIFTIILIFLLKSFATGLTTITPSQGMVLPALTVPTQAQMKEALKVELLPEAVLIDQKPVATMHNFQLPAETVDNLGPTPATISKPLMEALSREKAKYAAGHNDTSLIVMAHEKVPYATIKTVINTAAVVGYVDLQLVAISGD